MSRKSVSAVIGSFLVAGFALGAVQGCGSSSSSGTNIMSVCMQGCTKYVPCLADAGFPETVAECVQSCTASASNDGGTCSNESAIISAAQACAAKTTCSELEACSATIPDCVTSGSTGTGGTGGSHATGGTSGATGGTSGATGGTSGAAGGSGTTADCSVCTKAAACCLALGEPATTCSMISAASCSATTGADQTTVIQGCQSLLTGGASLSAACK